MCIKIFLKIEKTIYVNLGMKKGQCALFKK